MGPMSLFKELQELEDQGIDLIEILGQDRHLESPEALQLIISRLSRNGESLHAELLHYLTHRRFSAEQAEALWRAIMKHKGKMSEALGRKVSFRVAALDHLSARGGVLRQARLIAKPELEGILCFVNIDEVTGVYNRRYFGELLTHEVRRARRYGSPLSLLLVDLDDFKRVNDRWGHVEGDAMLRKTGRMLRESSRHTDAVCRYGGDEFVLLLPETSSAEAYALAERIRKAPTRAALIPGRDERGPVLLDAGLAPSAAGSAENEARPLTLSIGGATYPTDCEEGEELVALADQMCLDAKRRGKNRVLMSQTG
jgi:diguanylate cyclase (GGDEF)-like protein